MMQLIKLEQRTTPWYDLRKNSLGASDAPVVMGESPWKTNMRLWEEKVGLVPTDAAIPPHMQRGIDLEPIALAEYIDYQSERPYEPAIGRHQDISWMIASYDGYNHETGWHVEIKCPGVKDHETALAGKVPSKYRAQLQHQLLVSGKGACHYMSYHPDYHGKKSVILTVDADPDYQAELLRELRTFWACVCNLQPPVPKVSQDDYVDRSNSLEFRHHVERERDLDRQIKHLTTLRDNERARLIEMCEGQPSKGAGVKIMKVVTQGRVNYERVVEQYNVDIDQFRGTPTESWRIIEDKGAKSET